MKEQHTDTNGAVKNPSTGELENNFLLDEELPNAPIELKRHMAREFMEMGFSKDEIKQLISMMK